MKTLIIAEKPSVARDIVGALPGSFDEHKNFYESDDYVVTFAVVPAALGRLRSFLRKELGT